VLPRTLLVPQADSGLRGILWEGRQADMLLQVALIFSGVLGLLGLLSEQPNDHSAHREQQP
jgi:hypothetical protein